MKAATLLVMSLAALAMGQRPFFAGLKPIGYPEVTTEALADRFGEVDGTTQRLPVEANGDRNLVDRLSKLPIDQQPFWFINWQAIEANRQKPQTYPQKPNVFVDPIPNNIGSVSNSGSVSPNTGNGNFNLGNPNSGVVNRNSGSVNPNSGSVNPNSGSVNPNSGSVNPNSGSVNPNSGSVNPNSSSVNTNSGDVNLTSGLGTTVSQSDTVAGFVSSNRFGAEEYPKKKDSKDENVYSVKPVRLGDNISSDKKKALKDTSK